MQIKHKYGEKGTALTFCLNCGGVAKVGLTDDVFCEECEKLPYKEVTGNLVTGALTGYFDVVAHGCNCFCTMKSGIAPQMARAFGCDTFPLEHPAYLGDKDKLGTIDYQDVAIPYGPDGMTTVSVANLYTQYRFNRKNEKAVHLDYTALRRCFKQLNMTFEGEHIGLPMIGCGRAGGDWKRVQQMIKEELKNCCVTIVKYEND